MTEMATELHDLRRRFEAAENAGNPDAITDRLADDAVIMVPDFPVQEGKATCRAFVTGVMAWQRENLVRHIHYDSAEVRVVGAFAIDRGTFAFTADMKSGGERTNATGKYLFLYSRHDDGWKLWRVIVSLDEEEQAAAEQHGLR